MGRLTREQVLARKGKLKTEDVPVPEFGEADGFMTVKEMTGRERDAYEFSCLSEQENGKREWDPTNMRARLVAATVVDETGQFVFTPEDIEVLGEIGAAGLQRIFNKAQELNAMTADDVRDLEKNSGRRNGAGDSGSPSAVGTPTPTSLPTT